MEAAELGAGLIEAWWLRGSGFWGEVVELTSGWKRESPQWVAPLRVLRRGGRGCVCARVCACARVRACACVIGKGR